MSVLFSVLVHEKIEVVRDLIGNFQRYNPGCSIVLHVSQAFREKEGMAIAGLPGEFQRVFINPESVRTGLVDDSILRAHLSNVRYGLQEGVEFEYIGLNASNDLFVKEGLLDWMRGFDAGMSCFSVTESLDWSQAKQALRDGMLRRILAKYSGSEVYGSQVEGLFMSKAILEQVYRAIESELGKGWKSRIEQMLKVWIPVKYYRLPFQILLPGVVYAKEEIYFASLLKLFSKRTAWVYVYMNWVKGLVVDERDLEVVVGGDRGVLEAIMKKPLPECVDFFAVKRVRREIDDPIRKRIREMVKK